MKHNFTKFFISMVTFGVLGLSANIAAAADEDIAVTSTIESVVEVSTIVDLVFGSLSTGAAADATGLACLYSNDGETGAYQITFSSANANAGVFRMKGVTAETAFLPYTLFWDDQVGGAAYSASLVSGVALAAQAIGAIPSAYPCVVNNAIVKANISDSAADGLQAQAYTDTITMVVAAS